MQWLYYAFIAIICESTLLVLFKLCVNKFNAHVGYTLFISYYITTLLFIPLVLITVSSGSYTFDARGLPFYAASLIVGVIASFFQIKALGMAEVSYVEPLENIRPFFVVIFSFILLKELPSKTLLLGISCMVIGALYLYYSKNHRKTIQKVDSKASFLMIAVTAAFAFCTIMDKQALHYINPVIYGFLRTLGSSLFYVPFLKNNTGVKNKKTVMTLLFAIGVLTVVAIVAINTALTLTTPNKFTPIYMTRTLFVAFIGFEMLKEEGLWRRSAATIAMIIGVYFVLQ